MPELPEVESIKRTLEKKILGKKITGVKIFWSPAVVSLPGKDFAGLVKDRVIEGLGRRGKYLLIYLSGGLTMIIHFRMTGRLIYYPENCSADKHTHAVFSLDKGEMHYSDIRKFGRIQIVPAHDAAGLPSLAKLGPEPLDEEFTLDRLRNLLMGKKTQVKGALLDQKVIAGLGNIYVDEALFRAGILPDRQTSSLQPSEIKRLFKGIVEVLQEGIEARGTSFRDYRDADGNKGLFQETLRVYGRGGLECKNCGQILTRQKIAGRTTVFCRKCQK